jgi:hypothetical protein
MVAPTLTVRIDFANDGAFTGDLDSCAGRVLDCSWTRGRSADFGAEAIGTASFLLDNFDDRYTPDRNWHDNPSFEDGTTGWSVAAIGGLAAATSITQVSDSGAGAGTKAGEAVLTATSASGVHFAIPYAFRSGVTYAITVWLKSMSGNLNVIAGTASAGAVDNANSSGAITTSWAQKTWTWTPSADRTDAVFYVCTTTAAAATVRIDAIQINPGATANPYIEAPTKGQLVPGRPVHIYATYSATDYPQFYGFTERLTPNPIDRTVAIVCYDQLRRMQEVDVVVAASSVYRTAGDFRREVLGDAERGTRNLLPNPEFATNTTGWDIYSGGTITRVTTDAPEGAGTTSADLAWTAGNCIVTPRIGLSPVFSAGQTYRFSVYLRVTAGTLAASIGFWETVGATVYSVVDVTATTAWQRFTVDYTPTTTVQASANNVPRVFVKTTSGTLRIGGAAVTRGQALYPYAATGIGRWPNFCDNGSFDGGSTTHWAAASAARPVSGGAAPNNFATTASQHKYGSGSLLVDTPATAKAGVVYFFDVAAQGVYFIAGQPYTVSMWIRPTSNMPYRVGIESLTGGTDEAHVTGTATANVWTQVTVTWTPAADHPSQVAGSQDPAIHVLQTDATARTFYVDGVRVIPANAADDFEMTHWNLPNESDRYLLTTALAGAALSALTTLNGLTLSRHFIKPAMASPFYQYVVTSRTAAPASAETFSDDLADFTGTDIDRASIVNVVPVAWSTATNFYSDAASVGKYGPRPASTISGAAFIADGATADQVGAALIARYKDPRARPVIKVENRWPSQLQRELDDLVTVTFGRLRITAGKYLIQRLETKVSEACQRWETTYALEESP